MTLAIDDPILLSAPIDLAASAGVDTAVLRWTAATCAAALEGYTVFRNGVAIGRTMETRFAVDGLTQATGYVFTVAAVDAAGRLATSPPVALLTQTGTASM